MSTVQVPDDDSPAPTAREALVEAHSVLQAAIFCDHVNAPPVLLYAAVEVANAAQALECEADSDKEDSDRS